MSTRAHLRSTPASLWWALASFLGLAKLTVFVLDSNPQVLLGDSISYLTTAIEGWIPPDRSFVYGFLVYNVTTRARSLSSLVAVQTCAGIATALITALILVRFFRAPFLIAAAMAVAVATEPQHLLYERFVMTESLSTALFAAFLFLVLEYLHFRKMWLLIAVQVAGVVLIAFRLTYVPLVAATTFVVPFMAYVPVRKRVQLAVHVLISLSLFAILHSAYKHWNGYLSKLPAAYLYADGYFLITTVSPLVTPADTDIPELVPALSRPLAYASGPNQIISRKAELYLADGLVARLKGALKDDYQANVEAKRIAYRVIWRDPVGCIRLAVQTYLLFYSREHMSESMRQEAGMRELEPDHLKVLSHYHLDATGLPFMKSLTRQYYLASWPFFLLLLHTPVALLLAAVMARPSKRRFLWFLVLITSLQGATVQMLEVEPSTRYLHPMSVPFVIAIGVCAARLLRSHVPNGASSEGRKSSQILIPSPYPLPEGEDKREMWGRDDFYRPGIPARRGEHYGALVRFARRHAGTSLLDLGCGFGAYSSALADEGWKCVGCDINLEYLRTAAGGGLPVVGADSVLPFLDRSFDSVLIFEVIEHVPNVENLLAEAFRVARKNVLITVPNSENIELMKQNDVTYAHMLSSDHLHFFDPASLETLLRRYSKNVSIERSDPILPFWFVGRSLPFYGIKLLFRLGVFKPRFFSRLYAVASVREN